MLGVWIVERLLKLRPPGSELMRVLVAFKEIKHVDDVAVRYEREGVLGWEIGRGDLPANAVLPVNPFDKNGVVLVDLSDHSTSPGRQPRPLLSRTRRHGLSEDGETGNLRLAAVTVGNRSPKPQVALLKLVFLPDAVIEGLSTRHELRSFDAEEKKDEPDAVRAREPDVGVDATPRVRVRRARFRKTAVIHREKHGVHSDAAHLFIVFSPRIGRRARRESNAA